jgi:2-oxoglutarate dehydrogenase complex dehydrogenase (E1) component-like enzyme
MTARGHKGSVANPLQPLKPSHNNDILIEKHKFHRKQETEPFSILKELELNETKSPLENPP